MVALSLSLIYIIITTMLSDIISYKATPIESWAKKQIIIDDNKFKIYEFNNKRHTEEKGDIAFIFQNSISDNYNFLIYLSLDDIVYDEEKKVFSNAKWTFDKEKDKIISKLDPFNINNQKYYILFYKTFSNYFTVANELDVIKLLPNDFIFIEKLYSKKEIVVEFTNANYNIFVIRTYLSGPFSTGTIELIEKESGVSLFKKSNFGMNDAEYVNTSKNIGKTYLIYVRNFRAATINLRFAIDMMPDKVIELIPESHVNRYYVSNNEYDFFVDLSKYNENEENTIQIQLDLSSDYEDKKLQIYSKQIQCEKQSMEDHFDFTYNEFPIGLTTNQYDRKTVAVYFKKTRTETENIFLLLKLVIQPFTGKAQKLKIVLTNRIEIIRLDSNAQNDIMRTFLLKPELPVFIKVQLDPNEINRRSNVVFRCLDQNVQNITFGNLITDQATENLLTIQNQLYVIQRGAIINENNNTITLKYINSEMIAKSVTIEIAFVKEDLIYLSNVRQQDNLPLEMINCNKALYLIGCYDSLSFPFDEKYMVYIEKFYGTIALRYKDRLDFNGRFIEILPNATNSRSVTNDYLELDNQIDFFKLTCSTPSRISLHFFKQETPVDETELKAGNTMIFILRGGISLRLKLQFYISKHLIQIKSIDKKELLYNLDEDNGKLDAEPFTKEINKICHAEKMYSLSFSADSDTLIYLSFSNSSDIKIIVDGNTEIESKSNLIKLKHSDKNDYDYARISITPKSSLSSVGMKYAFGITKDNFISHPQHLITLKKEWVIMISNPYRKSNQQLNETNNEYYYFAIQFICDNEDFLVYFDYSFVSEPIQSNVSITSASVIQNGNVYRMAYDKEKGKDNDYVVMSINRCDNKSSFDIKFDGESLKRLILEEKREIYSMNNYEIDLKIIINPLETTNSSIGMNYFFATHKDYQDYRVNSNYTIMAKDDGSKLNLKWHPYITNHPTEVTYSIYISEPNKGSLEQYDNFCMISVTQKNETFVLDDKTKLVSYSNDDYSNEETLNEMYITIKKGGKYSINIIGHGDKRFPIITSYDAIEIEILRPFNYLLWSIVGVSFLALIGGIIFFVVKYLKKKKLKEDIKIDNSIEPFPDEINNNKITFINNSGNEVNTENAGSLTDKLV